MQSGKQRSVVLLTPRNRIRQPPAVKVSELAPTNLEQVEVRGILRLADARSEKEGIIEIIDEKGVSRRVKVPRGMMNDIVRPMFDSEVVVTGQRGKQLILLEDIRRAEE